MESELRAVLKPQGPVGNLFFDRCFSCVLRLILVARLEGNRACPQKQRLEKANGSSITARGLDASSRDWRRTRRFN